jgi:hypothetical protein
MGKPKAPKPPDPIKTAEGQTSTNVSTAIANANLGNVNQVTPYGDLNYDQTGSYSWRDPTTGANYNVPQFTATQTFSPSQQAIFDQTNKAETNLAGIAAQQSGFLKDYLSQPISLGNEEVESRLFELGSKRLDPALDRQRQGLESRLSGKGLKLGSDQYAQEMSRFDEGRNDAYNQLLLSGRGQAVQEQIAERNQPINEITALLSQSQVQQPNFINSQQPSIPTTDYAGIVQDDYRNQMSAWQQEQAQRNSMLGGLFGLGSSLIASDRRLKTDIERVGKSDDGLPIYSYRYKAGGPTQIGVMAQDVQKTRPEAVATMPDGMMAVDYGKVFQLGS